MTVLVVAPHPDDETIGCGGTLALATGQGERAVVAFLTSGELGLKELPVDEARRRREAEAEEAAAVLGLDRLSFLRHEDWFLASAADEVGKEIRRLVEEEAPTRLLAPHADEWHPDHAAASAVVAATITELAEDVEVLTYEVWTPMLRHEQAVDISTAMETKLSALGAYRSQLETFRYDSAIIGLNGFRGALAAHCPFAEVFGGIDRSGCPPWPT